MFCMDIEKIPIEGFMLLAVMILFCVFTGIVWYDNQQARDIPMIEKIITVHNVSSGLGIQGTRFFDMENNGYIMSGQTKSQKYGFLYSSGLPIPGNEYLIDYYIDQNGERIFVDMTLLSVPDPVPTINPFHCKINHEGVCV